MSNHLDLTAVTGSQHNQYLSVNGALGEVDAALADNMDITFTAEDFQAITISEEDFRRHGIFIVDDTDSGVTPENDLTFPAINRGVFQVLNRGQRILRLQTAGQSAAAEYPRPNIPTYCSASVFCDGTSIIRCNAMREIAAFEHAPVANTVFFRLVPAMLHWIHASKTAAPIMTWTGGSGTPPSSPVSMDVKANGASIGTLTFKTDGKLTPELDPSGGIEGVARDIKLELIWPANVYSIGDACVTMIFTI